MEKNIVRKVHITYKMIRGANDNEVAETCVDLPISQERYDEIVEGIKCINGENEVWRTMREALQSLTYLQGYNKLGAWSIELEIDG